MREQEVEHAQLTSVSGTVQWREAIPAATVDVRAVCDEQSYQLKYDFFAIAGIGNIGRGDRAAEWPDLKKVVASGRIRIGSVIEKKMCCRDLPPITGAMQSRASRAVERLCNFWIRIERTAYQVKPSEFGGQIDIKGNTIGQQQVDYGLMSREMSGVNGSRAQHGALTCEGRIFADQAGRAAKIASLAGAENLIESCHHGVMSKNSSNFVVSLTICAIQLS